MNTSQKRYDLTLFNSSYSILSDESEDQIKLLEEKINNIMYEISKKVSTLTDQQITMLALLEVMNDRLKNDYEIEKLSGVINELTNIIKSEV